MMGSIYLVVTASKVLEFESREDALDYAAQNYKGVPFMVASVFHNCIVDGVNAVGKDDK